MCASTPQASAMRRRADVRGIGEHLGQRDEAVHRLVVVDGEAAVAQRHAHVPHRVHRRLAGIERHRQRQDLEGRAHLVDAGGQPVDARRIVGFLRIVRIEVRLRHHRDDLAGVDVEDQAGRRLGLELLARLDELVAHRELHAQIEGEIDRALQAVAGEPGHVQRGEPLPVEPLLHAGDALVVDVHQADLVRDDRAVRIDALVLGQEADAGNAEPVHFALLLRRDLALEPDEAALRRQTVAHFLGVEVGQRRGEQFDRLVDVDQLARLGEQRRRLDVGGEDFAAAVEDVGPRGGDRVLADGAAAAVALAHIGEHHELGADDAIDAGEEHDGEAEPRLGLDIAVDVAAVEQRADEALPAGFAKLRRVRHAVTVWPAPAPVRCRWSPARRRAWRRSDRRPAAASPADAAAGGRAYRTAST